MGLDTKKPPHLPPEAIADIYAFARESQKFVAGEIDPETFTAFRTLRRRPGRRGTRAGPPWGGWQMLIDDCRYVARRRFPVPGAGPRGAP